MFEKEAEEYQTRKHHQRLYGHKPVVMKELNITYKDGFKDGYNKANEKYIERLSKAKEIILKLYNAGRDVLMCRAEEKVYDNLSEAINDRIIDKFLQEVEND